LPTGLYPPAPTEFGPMTRSPTKFFLLRSGASDERYRCSRSRQRFRAECPAMLSPSHPATPRPFTRRFAPGAGRPSSVTTVLIAGSGSDAESDKAKRSLPAHLCQQSKRATQPEHW